MNNRPINQTQYHPSSPIYYRAALRLARECRYDRPHSMQVARLARALFDDLRQLHRLGENERLYLECAAILHDIGWLHGQRGHHKNSLRIIRDSKLLPFNPRERLLTGSIARYHRRAEPSVRHKHFQALDKSDRRTVRMLAAILRLADGLDNEHQLNIKSVSALPDKSTVYLRCRGKFETTDALRTARAKALLFEKIFKRRVIFKF